MARLRKKMNGDYAIDKGVPIPPRTGGRISKYPWGEMSKGDSFFADKAAVSAAISWQRKHAPVRFASRREGEGFRIWRTK